MNIALGTDKRPTGFTTVKGQLLLVLKRKPAKENEEPKAGDKREEAKTNELKRCR